MFLTIEDARLHLAEFVDPPLIETFVALLEPVSALVPVAAEDAPPGTHRVGGAPLAGSGLDWPVVDASALLAGTLDAGHPDANAGNRAHLDAGTPMAFIGQIELAELTGISALADLPDEGRLLFFYDFLLGPYESTATVGRVIWDRTDRAEATEVAPPEALLRAAAEARAATAELNAEYGVGEDWDQFSTIFMATRRPARVATGLELPMVTLLDPERAPAGLIDAALGKTADDGAHALLGQYDDAYYAGADDSSDILRLLGQPVPEQDDPRYDAVITSTFGKQFLSNEEWDANRDMIMAALDDWTMLAQLDISSWYDPMAEGQVYFLIRKEDLAAHRFDRVIPVYQQT